MSEPLGFFKNRSQLLIVEGVRVAFLVGILAVTASFQAAQPAFIHLDLLLPVYLLLAAQFAINAVYLIFFERASRGWQATSSLFALETAFISALIFYTGVNQSIFLFLYLVNIILAGFVFQRRGAFLAAAGTSISFSLLMILGPQAKGQTAFFAVVLNNIAFIAVAGLSGFLSEQLNFMGSELKERGRSLAALQNLNELIVRNMATGLVTIDAKGAALLANHAADEILGLASRSGSPGSYIEGRSLEETMPGLFARVAELEFDDAARRSERFDWTHKTDDGRLTLEITVSRLRGSPGGEDASSPTGYVLTFEDLTKVRRLEFAMRQSEKLAAVGQLAAGIAHEIRNPLASISGSIQLLESSLPAAKDAEERKLMRIVLKEIDRLNGLISEFLVYVRPDRPKEDPIDLAKLAREILEFARFNGTLRQDVVQDFSVDEGAPLMVSGDRDKLKQAILNIVINAYQAMIEIERPIIKVSVGRHDRAVQLKISDRGVGIEESRLRKIFEPFHTTKPKGTGLGLAVTHKIIENHGGKIFVESAPGAGTEFTLEFPEREQVEKPQAPPGEPGVRAV